MKSKILIVDDESSICDVLSDILNDEGYEARAVSSGEEALEVFNSFRPDVILLDVWLGGIDGITTLQKIKEQDSLVGVIMMSGHGTIHTAVKATREGAYDFIEKPFAMDKVLIVINNYLEWRQTKQENQSLKETFTHRYRMIGKSSASRKLGELIDRAAPSNGRVLIEGENGTGKELIARNIHFASRRSTGPFIAVNCAAIPEELIESELFGHEKGAFTGAAQKRQGKFALASGGTLFLDEIADMSLATQAKVLRITEDQLVTPVGATSSFAVDVRIISASNKNLAELVQQGTFREDLYYRLNVIPVYVPPLRERSSDIPVLLQHFLKSFCADEGMPVKSFTQEAEEQLMLHHWPGNIRELKNLVERLVIMAPGDIIDVEDLPGEYRRVGEASGDIAGSHVIADSLRQAREAFERSFIEAKLDRCGGNVTKAAELMGIDRVHLHKKIKHYGLK
ncbi:sigma 54-interacting transcriptional regulator [Desulfurispira natronophila]|uniref:Two-component system nitrogen regulation response regulator NtrX n=1 Tax=Desulfurispira natronophila TaxID=682562 RepID=A0A7W7Y3B3_9BACT|nr:two-component system nitrogen regulation response regulator NtrX [Desulfurispira natronophila]